MKSQEILSDMVKTMPRMARGRLCVLSRSANGGRFYHLQYRRNTKLFQKYIPLAEVAAYEEATEQYRRFMKAVDAFVDDLSRKSMEEIAAEAGRKGNRPVARIRRKGGQGPGRPSKT